MIATAAKKAAIYNDGLTATNYALSDENGFSCCCTEPNCCTTCSKRRENPNAGCGTCSNGFLNGWPSNARECCFTKDTDLVIDGYWFQRLTDGPDFWTMEMTQTGVATQTAPALWNWEFTATVRERCRVNGIITDVTYSTTAILTPGYEREPVNNSTETCWCRHLNLPVISGGPTGCFGSEVGQFLHPIRNEAGGFSFDDVPSSLNCYQDNRSATGLEWGFGLPRRWDITFYYRVEKCAERCENDCTTCP